MKILVAYFSGTGNTARVAREIARCLHARGHEAEALSIEGLEIPSLEGVALGVGFPSYGLHYPRILEDFLERLPEQARPVLAFVFSTHAWATGNALTRMARRLEERNILTVARTSFACPSNGARTFFHREHPVYRRMVAVDPELPRKLDGFAAQVDGALGRFAEAPFGDPGSIRLVPRLVGAFAKHVMEGRLYRGFKVERDRCIGCKRCVMDCPDDNLVMEEGKARFVRGNDCLRCMRCITVCPVNAILFGERSRGKGRYTPGFRDGLFREVLGEEQHEE
ncbi:MAG: EFR1 family ferrodoxin [Synergistales bacterium]|nr:EFR1 family ferrodoxin [Synergistales bacterium]